MRHTEFWARLEQVLGTGYYRSWADQYVMGDLGRTASEALEAGVPPRQVWTSVWRALDLPETLR